MNPRARVPRTAYSGPLPEGAHRGNQGTWPCYQAPRWTIEQDGSGPGGLGSCAPCAAAAIRPRLASIQGPHPRASRAEVAVTLQDESGRPLNGRVHLFGANNFTMTTFKGWNSIMVPTGRYNVIVEVAGRPRRAFPVLARAGLNSHVCRVPFSDPHAAPVLHGMGRIDPMVAPPGSSVTAFAFRTPLSYAAWRHWTYQRNVAVPHPLAPPDEVMRTYQWRSPQHFFPPGVQQMLKNTRGVVNQMRKAGWEGAAGMPMQGMFVKAGPVDVAKFLEVQRLNGLAG